MPTRQAGAACSPGVEGEALAVSARQVARQAQRGLDLLVLGRMEQVGHS